MLAARATREFMKKHVVAEPRSGELGVGCSCGTRFATVKLADSHAADQNLIEAKEEKAKLEQAAEKVAPAEKPQEPKEAPKAEEPAVEPVKAEAPKAAPSKTEPAKSGEIVTRPMSAAITNMEMADQMVLKYATNLINSEAATEFQTRMKLIQRLNPKLANVSPQSLFMAMMACVHLRLMPNTTEGLAYIIPYGNEAQFQIGYKGLAELAYRTGNVVKIDQEAVFEGDEFEWSLGLDRSLTHKPNPTVDRTKFDNLLATYATVQLADGAILFDVVTRAELDKIKKSAKASGPGTPWAEWPVEMAKKTATKRLAKLLPKSSEDNRFKVAAEIDSLQESGKRLVIDAETGEIFGEDPNTLPGEVQAQIDQATTVEQLQGVLRSLPVADQKKAAGAVMAKLKELA